VAVGRIYHSLFKRICLKLLTSPENKGGNGAAKRRGGFDEES